MTTAPRYSLVVPVYNEGENIAAFCRALAGVPPGNELLICHDFEGDDNVVEVHVSKATTRCRRSSACRPRKGPPRCARF